MSIYHIPNPQNSNENLQLTYNLVDIANAESRVEEIATVTPSKCPELMATFSKACFSLGRTVSNVTYQYQMAKKRLANRKAVLVIDIVPGKIKEKDLKTSEDVRQGFMDLDPEYNAAYEALARTEALLILVERKLKDMEGALNAVKKVLGETYGVTGRPNPHLSVQGESGETYHSNSTGLDIGRPRY